MSRRIRLLLVRHGATSWSATQRLNGWTDVPLSSDGRRQARRLRPIIEAARPGVVYSSDLVRARETAEIAGCAAKLDARLREFNFGSWEGRRWEEIPAHDQEALLAFDGIKAPAGEAMVSFRQRIRSFLRDLEVERCVVVTHGGVIRAISRSIGGRDPHVLPGAHAEVILSLPEMLEP